MASVCVAMCLTISLALRIPKSTRFSPHGSWSTCKICLGRQNRHSGELLVSTVTVRLATLEVISEQAALRNAVAASIARLRTTLHPFADLE
eukprot:m.749257 g.749257  ORF g.749257 m.749257 type:complete len:91 (+) comp58975_c0_seq1:2070-2342(+)